ncbi:MAG TPA: NADH-quinone oxidoreductase subunit C [Bacteroidales bacterium]|jgi:NADH:ubiquinone oxidoreductase subunit C|nr:NADH-quinone oxidoreductase subunit C [Bacteroidales bacterium]
MDKAQLTEFLKKLDETLVVTEGKQFIEAAVAPDKLHNIALILRDDASTKFDFLFCLSGVDYKQDLGVVYHLRSTELGHTLVLKTRTPDRVNPVIGTVSDIWKTAEFHEREVFDLFGIKFANHPDLRRFFLDKTWGFPLRKDYVDDVNIVTK